MGLPGGPLRLDSAELPLLGAFEVTFSLNRFIKFFGPGLLMSIAYVDPGNLESDLQVGANAGYSLLWVLLWCTISGYVVQMQAAKLGVVTGKHLAEHCRDHFSPHVRYFLWLMAEIAIIGSDIQEVIGSAIALLLLSHGAIPLWGGVILSLVLSFVMLLTERFGVRTLEGVFGALISVMVGSFAVMFVKAHVPLVEVAKGFVTPTVPRPNISQAVALVGSLIMPHNIYLHSALVQTRKLRQDDEHHKREALVYYGIESALSLLVSVFINMFVTGVFAAGFYGQALQDIGLENAGQYLGRTYGPAMVYIWALGLLAAGQSSTMTGAYTGQFVMTGYLRMKVSSWLRILITRSVALVPALVVSILTRNSSSSTALDQLNQWLNLLQSIQLPFALIPVLAFNSSERLMGKQFANSKGMVAATVGISLLVMLVNVSGVLAFTEATLAGPGALVWAAVGGLMAVYLGLVAYTFLTATAAGPSSSGGQLDTAQPLLADGDYSDGDTSGGGGSGGGGRRSAGGWRVLQGGSGERQQQLLLQQQLEDVEEAKDEIAAGAAGEGKGEEEDVAGAAGWVSGRGEDKQQQQPQPLQPLLRVAAAADASGADSAGSSVPFHRHPAWSAAG